MGDTGAPPSHPLPLTKTLHPDDYALLSHELSVVDASFDKASPQHHHRRWEYALALRAHETWKASTALDVGGAGSPLHFMMDAVGCPTVVVDPAVNTTLANYLDAGGPPYPSVFCISVIEHVLDLDEFLEDLRRAVGPLGLLFLTMDIGPTQPDTYHFRDMRHQIFTPETWQELPSRLNMQLLDEADWTYNGPQVYDYSFASLALINT